MPDDGFPLRTIRLVLIDFYELHSYIATVLSQYFTYKLRGEMGLILTAKNIAGNGTDGLHSRTGANQNECCSNLIYLGSPICRLFDKRKINY